MAPRKKLTAVAKVAKSTKASKATICTAPTTTLAPAIPPARVHNASYHYPLLLEAEESCGALLSWFEGVEETRSMPWRKRWIDPKNFEGRETELSAVLGKRAYEVWVSEVMLQQTRVSTVIPYFNIWISKWPTVQNLAKANHDEVLSAWKGLGYYSRATRLHEGAKVMVAKSPGSACPLPSSAVDLQEFPGIGRYTAGAVSSIAFGEPEPVLDGNVARVLSRQLGLYVDAKDKKSSDILWEEADRLIKHVSKSSGSDTSAIPGQWNQAMMELGSTICTPRPRCVECPIQKTCRAYGEGEALSAKRQSPILVPDIEESCTLCVPLDTEDLVTIPDEADDDDAPKAPKKRKGSAKQSNTLSQYFTIGTPDPTSNTESDYGDEADVGTRATSAKKRKAPGPEVKTSVKSITTYCSLFPKKVPKKKVAEEECVVCLIELCLPDTSSKWLIEQRPAKGLLASLWQFPQSTLSKSTKTAADRGTAAQDYVSSLDVNGIDMSNAKLISNFSPLVHVFTHLKLTMHAFRFRITVDRAEDVDLVRTGVPARKWVDAASMDGETLSTGMRKCWDQERLTGSV